MKREVDAIVNTAVTTEQPLSLPMVEVQWNDAMGSGDRWDTPENMDSFAPAKTFSVGYLWSESRSHVTIVQILNDCGACGHVLVIPKGMVVGIRHLVRVDSSEASL
jgi:hypothetical protein